MTKATYRDLKVCAVIGDKRSDPFYLKQKESAGVVPRMVLRLDEGKPSTKGEPQTNTSSADHQCFGNQRTSWLEEKLVGFRRKVGDVTCIVVEVQDSGIPDESALEGVEAF